MAMVVVDDSCLQANSQPKSDGLVWGSSAAWRCSTFIKWTVGFIIIIIIIKPAFGWFCGDFIYIYNFYCYIVIIDFVVEEMNVNVPMCCNTLCRVQLYLTAIESVILLK